MNVNLISNAKMDYIVILPQIQADVGCNQYKLASTAVINVLEA